MSAPERVYCRHNSHPETHHKVFRDHRLYPMDIEYVRADLAPLASAPAGSYDEAVIAEVARAMKKFPTWPTDPLHAVAVLGEEFGELTKAVLQLVYEPHKTSTEEVKMEAIQTAAMALRFLKSLNMYEYREGPQHLQAPPEAGRMVTKEGGVG